jgi:prophage regulatory protein
MDFPKLVRLGTVLEMTTLSTATIYRLMKKGQFPRQIKISERSTRWVLDEIFEWMDGNFKARDEGES